MTGKSKSSALGLLLTFGLIFALILGFHAVNRRLAAGAKEGSSQASNAQVIQYNRTVELEFMTTTVRENPFIFYPAKNALTVHPGQSTRAYFYVQNRTNQPQRFFTVASSAPSSLARYVVRLDDFSAKSITVPAGETLKLPVDVLIDDTLPAGAKLLTLNYSLFPGSNP